MVAQLVRELSGNSKVMGSIPGQGTHSNQPALAGVAQWIECQPVNQRVAGSIPSQGTCVGCRPGPQYGASERQPRIAVSLPPLLPPSPLSKNK